MSNFDETIDAGVKKLLISLAKAITPDLSKIVFRSATTTPAQFGVFAFQTLLIDWVGTRFRLSSNQRLLHLEEISLTDTPLILKVLHA